MYKYQVILHKTGIKFVPLNFLFRYIHPFIQSIEIINNKARHNLIDAKYQQMAFRSVPTTLLFGIWSNKSDANLEDSDCTV